MKSSNEETKKGFIEKLDSVRIKLFTTLCIVVILIILFLVAVNSTVLESYYIYSKQKELMVAYEAINSYYNGTNSSSNLDLILEKLALSNSFDILIKTDNQIHAASSRDFLSSLTDELDINNNKH